MSTTQKNTTNEITTVTLSKPIVESFKNYCKENGLKLGKTIEILMNERLTKHKKNVK